MKNYKHIAFLCGYFDLPIQKDRQPSQLKNWQEQVYDNKTVEEYKNFFYGEFVDFCLTNNSNTHIYSYRYQLERSVCIPFGEKEYTFLLKNITAYVMPYDILIYSIDIEQETDDLNQITGVTSILRSILNLDSQKYHEFFNVAITPLLHLYAWMHHLEIQIPINRLIENGNKLKVFQIINATSSVCLNTEDKDILLFELGTLSKVGSYKKHEDNGITSSYLEEVLQNNKISFYNNWSALSLLDTFTILSFNVPNWLLTNWTETYFRLIYIHSLFLKFYLFRLNVHFRRKQTRLSQLEDELISFESTYCFHKISYNFLPLAIYKSIDSGLEISEERNQLYHLIDMENQRREKKNDKRVNKFLIFLTLLTMLSTLWDSSCLFNELYPYAEYVGSTIVGYKIVVSILSLIIILAIIIIFNKKK